MTGAVINPLQATGTVNMPTSQPPSMSDMNSVRISVLVDRLLVHLRGGSRNDSNEFSKLCISLSRAIDYAVANKELPVKAPELPGLLKQVCQWKRDAPLQAVIMVLLISIKGACRKGWFNEKDTEELQNLSNEISSSFCSVKDMNFGENKFHNSISGVMLRFYPNMKMGETLAFIEANLGYGAFVKDFDITKEAMSSNNKIYLFIAQIDDTETSSCIISPQQVNFLLNGIAVDGRTSLSKDPGPQTPTLVTHMLKLGTNLLQVVGQFNGKYIIIVGFMSMVSNPIRPILPNYVPPTTATPDLDNDLIEGPSTISLNCPISFKRIKTPIKGHLCKHRQCFDYDNYVDMNSRRPSWRCPHCSQSVCFTDVRIDGIMVKVLDEVGVNVSHVKISADGSWEAVNEGDDCTNKPQSEQQPPLHQQFASDVMDLTEGENYVNATSHHQDIDKKPSPAQLQQKQPNNPNNQVPLPPHMGNKFQRIHLPNKVSNTVSPPVIANAVSQVFSSNNERFRGTRVTRIPIAVQALPAVGPTTNGNNRTHQQQQQRLEGFHMNQSSQMIPPSQYMTPHPQQSSGYGHNLGHLNLHHQQQPVYQGGVHGVVNNQHGHQYAMSASAVLNNQQSHRYAMSAAQPGVQVNSWMPSGLPSEQHGDENWRPSGRMRGSLSGQAYSEALNQMMYFPTQPLQSLNTSRPVIPPQFQSLYAYTQGRQNFFRFSNNNGNGGGGGSYR
ncbi:hypothetical protein LXL04_029588 [Taraxacum kok-saghyz]